MAINEAEELELLELENENAMAAQNLITARPPGLNELQSATQTASVEPPAYMAGSLSLNPEPQMLSEMGRGFLGAPSKAAGARESLAYKVGEGGLPAALAMAGQTLAGGAGPLSAAGAGAGAGLGVAAQETVRALAGRAGMESAPSPSLGAAVKKVGTEAAVTAAGSYAIPKAFQLGASGAREATKRMAGTVSGVGGEAFERLLSRPKEVLKEIFEGPIEKAGEYTAAFKEAIERNFDLASQEYDDIIKRELLDNPALNPIGNAVVKGKRFDLFKGLAKDVSEIQKDFGFGLPNRMGSAGAEADEFLRVKTLIERAKNASAEDMYYLQRDLGRMARDKRGTSLGAALHRVDRKVNEFIAKRIPAVQKANEIYAPAKEMMVTLEKKIGKIEDLPAKVSSAYSRNTTFKEALEKIADELPAARTALESIKDTLAARPFAPAMAPLPRTGLAAGLGALGLGAAGMNPLALGAATVTAPFIFPRALAQLLAAGSKYAPKVKAAGAAARPFVPAGASALSQLLQAAGPGQGR